MQRGIACRCGKLARPAYGIYMCVCGRWYPEHPPKGQVDIVLQNGSVRRGRPRIGPLGGGLMSIQSLPEPIAEGPYPWIRWST